MFPALLACLSLAACGGGSNRSPGLNTSLGNVTVTAAATSLAPGANTTVTAAINGDTGSGSVTWSLIGPGTLSGQTATTVTYTAPATLAGAATATISATSTADANKFGAVAITVSGTPLLTTPVVYPGNANTAYSLALSVGGGTSPFTWSISAGTLPAGLSLGTGTGATNTISGTPTATGTSTVTIKVVDNAGLATTADATITILPGGACVLSGNFAYLLAGNVNQAWGVRAGTLAIASDGTVTGLEDYADSTGARSASALSSGTCKTTTANFGNLSLVSTASTTTFGYGALLSLERARVQETDGSGARLGGEVARLAANPALPTGDWAFGLTGVDATGAPLSIAGRLTVGADGTVSGGRADAVGAITQAGAALTGSFVAPGSNGRGTATLTLGGTSLPLAYYVTAANRLFLVAAGTGAPRLAGFATPQTGAGTFAASSLSGPAVLSTWGLSTSDATAVVSLGRWSNATATTVDTDIDTSKKGIVSTRETLTGAALAVDADGRTTVTTTNGAHAYAGYLDGASRGYFVETTGVGNAFGLLETQTAGPYEALPSGTFIANTQFAGPDSTLLLAPNLTLLNGTMSNPISGTYVVDTTNGRGVGATASTGFGGGAFVMYPLDANRIRILGQPATGALSTGLSIVWLER